MADRLLMYALSAIVILNIVAIVLLNNRIAAQEAAQTSVQAPVQQAKEPTPAAALPVVRTVVLEDSARCSGCFDIGEYVTALNGSISMQIEHADPSETVLFASGRLPALAFNQSLALYPTLVQNWESTGNIVTIPNGKYAGTWYVLPTLNPPYLNLSSNKVQGKVTATYLTMVSCKTCFDVHTLKNDLENFRLTPFTERSIDAQSTEGKALITKYHIDAVPTLLLDKEADVYPGLQPGWSVVGTIESDGTYVLRDLKRLNVTFYDLGKQELVSP
jgi:hypothetical protein